MQQLQALGNKLELLLKKYATLQAENQRLKETVSKQTNSIDKLHQKLSALEDGMAGIHAANAVLTTSDKNGMRKQLDTVIGEIDKILTTLDD